METSAAIRPQEPESSPAQIDRRLAGGSKLSDNPLVEPLRACYALVTDVGHLLQTGETRRILRLWWTREHARHVLAGDAPTDIPDECRPR